MNAPATPANVYFGVQAANHRCRLSGDVEKDMFNSV